MYISLASAGKVPGNVASTNLSRDNLIGSSQRERGG